jgi:hypothetical protein
MNTEYVPLATPDICDEKGCKDPAVVMMRTQVFDGSYQRAVFCAEHLEKAAAGLRSIQEELARRGCTCKHEDMHWDYELGLCLTCGQESFASQVVK